MRRTAHTFALAVTSLLLLAGPALAAGGSTDNGEGLVGETDDKIITFFSLGVVLFFTLFIIVMSWLQGTLEKRKDARKAAHLRSRTGW
jgi:cbb3-type cytochrome oxidase subunit 3